MRFFCIAIFVGYALLYSIGSENIHNHNSIHGNYSYKRIKHKHKFSDLDISEIPIVAEYGPIFHTNQFEESNAVISCKALSEVKSSLRTHRWRFDTFTLPGRIPYMENNQTTNQKLEFIFSIKVLAIMLCSYHVMLIIQAMKNSETRKKESTFSKSGSATLLTLVLNLCCMLLPQFMTFVTCRHCLSQICKAFMPLEVFKCISLCNVFYVNSNISIFVRHAPCIQTIFIVHRKYLISIFFLFILGAAA